MKKLIYASLALFLFSCGNTGPDVSKVPVDIQIDRFEQVFFKIDSNNAIPGLIGIEKQFPRFANDFTENILGAGPISDTNKTLQVAAKHFISSYTSVNDFLQKQFSDVSWLKPELKDAFQHVEYYFPKYRTPRIITFVGPFDAPGVALTPSGLAIGLQAYAGKDYPFYLSDQGQEIFPTYISRRFEKKYITVNCMKGVVEDLFPDQSGRLSLIEQMVEKGKRWYLLDKFVPKADDSLKTGYTKRQLDWAKTNEGNVWNYMLQQTDIFTTDPSFIQLYIGEGPSTQGFPENSPGNIGQWIGWQIVKAYADKNSSLTPQQVMQTSAKAIFEGSKYKPK
ncbi:hypothetical protein QEG73_24480 [Chitinophagaceae bacterium 26-R-25]|nr:hypothetical protein [Chitinophagaceae bacterium 26-R-25]